MNTLKVDFTNVIGKIKPMHAINNMPTVPYDTADLYKTYTEAHIPYARLHDTGGQWGGSHYVDIENIFTDFDADENDPASYDFAFTDVLLNAMIQAGVKPFYRLGCTIEGHHDIKSYHIYPPKDSAKWARICEHIIMHYNEGWADGYHFDIEYWEIWNEPDNEPVIEDNPMWKGTKEQFFELYEVAATYLKARFPHLKIGGYASCGFYSLTENGYVGVAGSSVRTDYFIEFFLDFMKYISDRKIPMDFFSWHSYAKLENNVGYAEYAKEKLTEFGYGDVEVIFNEWNPDITVRGELKDAANIASVMCAMHHTTTDMCMYYDGQMVSTYCGLFDPVHKTVFKAYYPFYAFGQLYAMGKEAASSCDAEKVYQLAAVAEDGRKAILLVNNNEEAVTLKMEIGCHKATWKGHVVCEESDWSEFELAGDEITLQPSNIVLLQSE